MKINIVGWYGHKNLGDETFREVFTQRLSTMGNLSFTEVPDLAADAIILGGGGVVQETYLTGLDAYKGKLFAVGVDIAVNGPRWEAIQQLPFQRIYVRSLEYAQIAGKESPVIHYCPDLAFAFPWSRKQNTTNSVGFIISGDIRPHASIYQHILTTAQHLQQRGTDVSFICMYTNSEGFDLKISTDMAAQRNARLIVPQTPEECLDCISEHKMIVSMRFHGAIFSVMTGTPFIALANKGKCSLFCEQEHLYGNFVELVEATEYKLLNRIDYFTGVTTHNITQINHEILDSMFEDLTILLKG